MLPQQLSNSSEFNVDATLILSDLDRSLRSTNIGDQCEAIVRVPRFFERYPFPILINSASLKLSEVYRDGSNFLRLLIFQVMEESEKHLDKILNIDDFVRNLFAVSYSNDPLARSITLRCISNIARKIANNKKYDFIHHFIRNSLDSVDELEVESAIEASIRFAIVSKSFAQNIYPKIMSIIDSLTTSIPIKIKSLDVINNVHHNFIIAEDAREKLITFLQKYNAKNFVCKDLHTLTTNSILSVIHIPDQVKLLLDYFVKDPRYVVKISVLDDLQLLAKESAHLWEEDSITQFVQIVLANFTQNNSFFNQIILESNAKELKLLCGALGVLSELLNSPSIFINHSTVFSENLEKIINFSTQIIHQSVNCSVSDKVQILLVAKCFTILTNLCLHHSSDLELADRILHETCIAFEAYLMSKYKSNMNNKESKNALQVIFRCLVVLCRAKCDCRQTSQITDALSFILLNAKGASSWYEVISETICALAPIIHKNESLTSEEVLDRMKCTHSKSKNKPTFTTNHSTLSKIVIIFFQLKCGSIISEKESNLLINILKGNNLWFSFKIVREAMRFGHHIFANKLLNCIKANMEPVENTYFWINSLTLITSAESLLSENSFLSYKGEDFLTVDYDDKKFENRLSNAISIYTEGFNHLKASVSNSKPMRFQCEFVKLRMKYLQAHQHFRQCCKLLQSSPPPTSAMVGSSGNFSEDFLKCGRIVFSMRKCAHEFRSIADNYSNLYQSTFNADPNTLSIIQLLQHSCTILAEVIENMFQGSHRINSLFVAAASNSVVKMKGKSSVYHEYNIVDKPYTLIEHKEFEDVCTMISDLVRNDQLLSLANLNLKQSTTGGNHFLSVFTKQMEMLLRISTRILSVSLPFPRFYFQSIQSISIKLELSPQPRNNQDYIPINQSIDFVLKVEGVVIDNLARTTSIRPVTASIIDSEYSNNPSLANYDIITTVKDDSKIIRKVNKILLTMNAVKVSSLNVNDICFPSAPILSMNSVVAPSNDYFMTSFLFSNGSGNGPLFSTGFYSITVETSIIDEYEAQWKTGPIQSITLKVIEDFRN